MVCILIHLFIDADLKVSEDQLMIRIDLDLKEDIGLLVIDYDLDGQTGSGGISNANKTKLKKDDVLYWDLIKDNYDDIQNSFDLTISFRIVTEYFDPNYENIYPEEFVIPVDEISFTAEWGNIYEIKLTGSSSAGYEAVPVS